LQGLHQVDVLHVLFGDCRDLDLECRFPEPSLFPGGDEASVWGLSRWAETSFMMAVTVFFGVGGLFDDAFIEDRKQMVPGVDFSQAGRLVPAKLLQLSANLDRIERQLADGRPFLLGDSPSLADLSAWHPHTFLAYHPKTAALLEDLEFVPAWLARVGAFGDGKRTELDSTEAIAIARDSEPAPIEGPYAPMPDGLTVGDSVIVLAEEAGSGTVSGELLASGVHEIAVRRHAERAGEVVVHFPRAGFLVVPLA
jgi:glutathione S-transferase